MKAIELLLPDANPITIPVVAIRSVVFQPKAGHFDDLVIISIDGWQKPYSYQGRGARDLYEQIKAVFEPVTFTIDPEATS